MKAGAYIVAAIIGALATVAVGYRQEIMSAIWPGDAVEEARRELIGDWRCQWEVLDPPGYDPPVLEDIVHVRKVVGNTVTGEGANPNYGTYLLDGRNSLRSVTFQYQGKGDCRDLVGVIILRKAPRRDSLKGVWWQLDKDDQLVGGTTSWNRIAVD
jgi:hypothetical protein